MALRVIKLGGSLLNLIDLRSRIESLLSLQRSSFNIWIVGGGTRVDELREKSQNDQLSKAQAHWLAIAAMDQNSQLLIREFGNWPVFDNVASVSSWAAVSSPDSNAVFLTSRWSKQRDGIPVGWEVTSDSIAAILALDLEADELVLLKSADVPITDSIQEISNQGYVDAHFPVVASRLGRDKIRFVNLRRQVDP